MENFVSGNNIDTCDNGAYLKNGSVLLDENGNNIDEYTFKQLIKKETSNFIHKNYSNIVVLAGAGASVVSNGNGINANFGKTVPMRQN